MKISASLYSDNKKKSLEELVRSLDAHEIDMFHIDCMDDEKVFDDIRQIRKISSTPIDLHIISATPEKYFAQIEAVNIEYVSFQHEELTAMPNLPKNSSTKFGLSIVSETDIRVFDEAAQAYSFVTIMTTVPGKSGGTFNRQNFQKILDFKHRYPNARIHVDGGVNDEIGFILRLMGIHAIVSGNYLMNHESLGAGMLSFHKSRRSAESSFRVADFATPVQYIPVLPPEVDFKTILQTIDDFKLGFAFITDKNGKLLSVVTNADIRRGLLRHTANMNDVTVEDITNLHPITIPASATLSEMIRLVNELNFIVLFLPVVDENNVLKGTILLNNLTRV